MRRLFMAVSCLFALELGIAANAAAEGPADPELLMAAQRKAIARLSFMDGVWKGTAWTIRPSGEKHTVTQTERVGPFLDGTVRVIEGRGYDESGKMTFNAFGTVSYNPDGDRFTLHSYALGRVGDFNLTPSADGFVWEIPAGPVTIRYMAVVKDGAWKEVGDRIAPGKDPVRFFEMNLKRVGDSDWPLGGAIGPK